MTKPGQNSQPLQLYIDQVQLIRQSVDNEAQRALVVANRLTVITCQLDLLIREMRASSNAPMIEEHAQEDQAKA